MPDDFDPEPIGYGPEYDAAWDAMTKKPWAYGLAPIHHGCFENGWRGAILAAAEVVNLMGATDAAVAILVLGAYDESPRPVATPSDSRPADG